MSTLDTSRHSGVFDPRAFGKSRIDVIGAGATGSRVVMALAKLGVSNIHVHDFDKVEGHNIANQLFRVKDVGRPKVEALSEIVREATGGALTAHPERVKADSLITGEIVFLLTDTMQSRREILEGPLRADSKLRLVIETRMGAEHGFVYAFDPRNAKQAAAYWERFYEDSPNTASVCGTAISVGPTADVLAGLAVWRFIRWYSVECGRVEELENELIFSLRPEVLVRTFCF